MSMTRTAAPPSPPEAQRVDTAGGRSEGWRQRPLAVLVLLAALLGVGGGTVWLVADHRQHGPSARMESLWLGDCMTQVDAVPVRVGDLPRATQVEVCVVQSETEWRNQHLPLTGWHIVWHGTNGR